MSSETQSTPPPSSSVPTTTASDPLSTTYSSSSSSSASSSLSTSSESPSTSRSNYTPPPPPPPTSSAPPTSTPSGERSPPPMSSTMSTSSVPPTTDNPPPPSSSAPPSTTMTSVSTSIVVPPPPSSTTAPSTSDTGMRVTTQSTSSSPFTSSTVSSSSSSSTSTPSPSLSHTSNLPGGPDDVSASNSSSVTPPPSGSSTGTQPGGSSSSSSTGGPSSPDRPGDSSSSTGSLQSTASTDAGGVPTRPNTSMGDGSPTDAMTTLSDPVTFTTTNAVGSTVLTVPSQFTTVIVTTLPGGTFTTFTEVIANPPGVLNPGDSSRDSVGAFFQNKGAVAGVFIAASLAISAIILFVIFALRRRRYRVKNERDAEIAAELAAVASNQRFADDEDHPVVIRNVPSGIRGRSPRPNDDEDDERLMYNSSSGLIMYTNFNGVGPPTQHMPTTSDLAYPAAVTRYAPARTYSSSPSPKKEPAGLPTTYVEPASPTGNSGWSSNGPHNVGAYYAGRRSNSVSPAPTTSAPASAYHGTGTHATSVGHAPSSYSHRPPTSAGKHGSGSGTGTGSGSGGVSVPSLMTAGPAVQRARSSSPTLEDMYPPEYMQFSSRPNSSSQIAPDVGYAYEPDPVRHNHQVMTDVHDVQAGQAGQNAYDGMRPPLSADIAMSIASRSMYSSREGGSMQWDDEAEIMPREDSRLDPVMRIRDGLASAASVGPRDHEDYTRRVVPQPLTSPSTVSHSHGHSHSTH